MPLEDFIIHTYLIIDNFGQKLGRLRQRGPLPKLTDAEVITMEIVGEYLGLGSDKRIFEYFQTHWQEWFPHLKHRTVFTRQCANLWKVKEFIHTQLIKGHQDNLFLFDGFPIPTCHKKRVTSHNPLKAKGGFGYCAAKDEKYFGFKGHLITSQQGFILRLSITAANIDERDVLGELSKGLQGMMVADKGLIRPELSAEMNNNGLSLQTPLRSNMKDDRSPEFVKSIVRIRRTIETVIGQLTERFCIQNIKTKDLWHLTAKVGRKILAHTFSFLVGNSLQFDQIVS